MALVSAVARAHSRKGSRPVYTNFVTPRSEEAVRTEMMVSLVEAVELRDLSWSEFRSGMVRIALVSEADVEEVVSTMQASPSFAHCSVAWAGAGFRESVIPHLETDPTRFFGARHNCEPQVLGRELADCVDDGMPPEYLTGFAGRMWSPGDMGLLWSARVPAAYARAAAAYPIRVIADGWRTGAPIEYLAHVE